MSDKHRTIIGLDPGSSTGVAVYIGGKLEKLSTVEPWRIPEVISITLPWPPKELSPNTRQHWSKLSRAKKAYRTACAWTAKEQGAKSISSNRLHVSMVFYPPNRRAFDLDNLLTRMKSGLDGLADVFGVDDKHWSLSIAKADVIGGMVKVEVRSND